VAYWGHPIVSGNDGAALIRYSTTGNLPWSGTSGTIFSARTSGYVIDIAFGTGLWLAVGKLMSPGIEDGLLLRSADG
jgi:hypothetical protein